MLNSEVAMGRFMNGAEKCIVVSSARLLGQGFCANTGSAHVSRKTILVQHTESFLNAVTA